MKKLGRKKKKNIDSVIEWRINKHLNKVDKRRSMSDVRSPWLSAGSASPELRHNQGELRQLVETTLSRMQNLPMDKDPFFKGLNSFLSKCIFPLLESISDLERRDMIVMAGKNPEGKKEKKCDNK